MLDRVVIEYSALGNRGLLWVASSVVVAVATGHWAAIPLVATAVWFTLGLNYLLKRSVRRKRPLHRRGRAPLIVAPASPAFPSSHAAMAGAGAVAGYPSPAGHGRHQPSFSGFSVAHPTKASWLASQRPWTLVRSSCTR